jgi:N-acetylmuramoyl-L-alanine amidase
MTPTHIILHHSLTKDGQVVNYNAIWRYHTYIKGWRDIGYQIIIENQRGRVNTLLGRMLNETGAHCIGLNQKSIGICMIGNFDIEPPSINVLSKCRRVCRSLMEIFNIPAERVQGHREYANYKSCPGSLFDLDIFRDNLC